MSQNIVTLPSNFGEIELCMGWDNPTNSIFCNVQLPDDDEEATDAAVPECIKRTSFANVGDVVATLKLDGVTLPASVVQAFNKDVESHARNVIRVFNPDGTLVQSSGL